MFETLCALNKIKILEKEVKPEGRIWYRVERNGEKFVVSKAGKMKNSWGWMAGVYSSHSKFGHDKTEICFNVLNVISYIKRRS